MSKPKKPGKARQSSAPAVEPAAVLPDASPAATASEGRPASIKPSSYYEELAATTFAELLIKSRKELATALTNLVVERAIQDDVEAAYRPGFARAAADVDRLHGELVEALRSERDHWLNEARQLREASARSIGSKGGKNRHFVARWYAKQIARLYLSRRTVPPSRRQVAMAIVADVARIAQQQGLPLSESSALNTVDDWIKEGIREGEIDGALLKERLKR